MQDEFLRELQPVDRVLGEIFERGVAGAEIIDGDLDAELAEILQRVGVPLRRLHQHRFGQLELNISRIDAPTAETVLDLALKLGGVLNCTPETLSESTGGAMPSTCHSLSCWQAASKIHLPSGKMAPVRSAIEMKAAGVSTPRVCDST